MRLPKVELTLGLDPRILVDGEDFTERVKFVSVVVEPGKDLPLVTLGIQAEVIVEGKTMLDTARESLPSEIALQFLDSIDPSDLSDKTLERDDLDGRGGVFGASLKYLKEKAREWI
jgi:hypothetical protein